MQTKATILLTVLMVGGAGCTGSSSSDEGQSSTLATLGVDLSDPAVRAEWEATCAALDGDAAVAVADASVEDAAVDDGDDDSDEIAEESAGRGDHDRTRKVCEHLGHRHGRGGHHHGRRHHDNDGDHDERHDRDHDEDCGTPDEGDDDDDGDEAADDDAQDEGEREGRRP